MNKKKLISYTLFTILVIALAIGGYFYIEHKKYFPSTDDAYIQANIINIAPQVTGEVNRVYVQNQQYVKKGQLLFTLNPKPFNDALNKAEAKLDTTTHQVKAAGAGIIAAQALVEERQAELNNTQKNTRRILTLVKRRLFAKASGDKAIRQLKVAEASLKAAKSKLAQAKAELGDPGESNARIRAAKAAVSRAKLNIKYTRISAPNDGYLIKFNLRSGTEVTAYRQLFALIETNQWWVNANFKETDLERIRMGQKATIQVDMYPSITFNGVVTSISRGSGASFSLLPPENATGNWVKVTQRFPVRIKIVNPDPNHPLRIGSSVNVTINTRSPTS